MSGNQGHHGEAHHRIQQILTTDATGLAEEHRPRTAQILHDVKVEPGPPPAVGPLIG